VKELTLTKTYKIMLPDPDTEEWQELVSEFLKEDPDYEDPDNPDHDENMEIQVLQGNIAFWLAGETEVGNYTDIVYLYDHSVS
jgi:hypothetical protein